MLGILVQDVLTASEAVHGAGDITKPASDAALSTSAPGGMWLVRDAYGQQCRVSTLQQPVDSQLQLGLTEEF